MDDSLLLAWRYDHQRFLTLAMASLLLAGCMVGPDYHTPATTKTEHYTEAPIKHKTVAAKAAGQAGKAQHFVSGKTIPAEWWHLFHSHEIDDLIRAGLANSPNLAAAKAALVQAQENWRAQIGSTLLPAVTANASGERELFNSTTFGITTPPSIFNLFAASVNVSYTLDVFGGLRRQVEASRAQVDYEGYELEAAHLTLTSNIVTTAITMASLRAQIQATQALIKSQVAQLEIVNQQFHLGGASRADVLTQQAQVAQTRATLPPLQQQLAQNLHALSVLIGELPSESRLPQFDLHHLHLPTELPISLPSYLARQRPDVQAAEALLHVASAQIGVATANMYPQVTLSGAYGYEANVLPALFSPINKTWNWGGALAQPIFNGGALFARKRAAVAAYQQAAAQYRQTVLQAFQNVSDTLRALEHDAYTLKDQKEAEIAAKNSLSLTQKQYRLGGVSYLSLLTAQRTYQQARISRIQAQAQRYTDTAALFQALGGGWWNRTAMDCNPVVATNLAQYAPDKFGKG